MVNKDDALLTYYKDYRAEVDTAADSGNLFLLDYLRSYGPMTLRRLGSDCGLRRERAEEIIATLFTRGMVEKRNVTGRIAVSDSGRQLLSDVLGEPQQQSSHERTRLLGIPQIVFRGSSRTRTDLIIGMTLAETFLLLLLIIWYGRSTISRDNVLQSLKQTVASLGNENRKDEEEIAQLKQRLDVWRQLTGSESPSPAVIEKLRGETYRGVAKCEENNVLIEASILKGHISVRLLQHSPRLSQWLAESGRPQLPVGVQLTDRSTIESFLTDIGEFYHQAKLSGAECRFDYRMVYESKEDYFDGRQYFERYFYPAALVHVN
jgi:hypothetical protein